MDDIAEKPPVVEAPFAEPAADARNATLGAICDQAAGRDILEAAPDSTGETIAKPRGLFASSMCRWTAPCGKVYTSPVNPELATLECSL